MGMGRAQPPAPSRNPGVTRERRERPAGGAGPATMRPESATAASNSQVKTHSSRGREANASSALIRSSNPPPPVPRGLCPPRARPFLPCGVLFSRPRLLSQVQCCLSSPGPDCSKCNSVAGFTRDPDGRGCIRLHDGPVATPKERGTERRSAKVLRITLVATALAAMGLLVFAGAAWGFQRRASLGPARRWGGAGTSTPPATPAMMNESRKPWTLRVNGDGSREGPAGPSVVRPEVDGGTLKGCVGRATAREGFGERRRVWQAEEDSGGGKGGGQGFCLPQPTGRAGELAGRARSSVAKAMSLFSLPTPLAPSKDTSLDDNSRMTKL